MYGSSLKSAVEIFTTLDTSRPDVLDRNAGPTRAASAEPQLGRSDPGQAVQPRRGSQRDLL